MFWVVCFCCLYCFPSFLRIYACISTLFCLLNMDEIMMMLNACILNKWEERKKKRAHVMCERTNRSAKQRRNGRKKSWNKHQHRVKGINCALCTNITVDETNNNTLSAFKMVCALTSVTNRWCCCWCRHRRWCISNQRRGKCKTTLEHADRSNYKAGRLQTSSVCDRMHFDIQRVTLSALHAMALALALAVKCARHTSSAEFGAKITTNTITHDWSMTMSTFPLHEMLNKPARDALARKLCIKFIDGFDGGQPTDRFFLW